MSNRFFTFSLLVIATLYGCSIKEPPIVGERCLNAEYYMTNTGQLIGYFTDVNDPFYEEFHGFEYCPKDYSVCSTDVQNKIFCHDKCPGDQIFCENRCVNPLNELNHCGAQGMCIDPNPDNDNYIGKKCPYGNFCEGGVCKVVCPEGFHEENNQCELDTAENCGKEKSVCQHGEVCSNGVCASQCESGLASCSYESLKLCVNPALHPLFCGASLDDCTGYVECSEMQECTNGTCVCKGNSHKFNGDCELNSISNCGGHDVRCDPSSVPFSLTVMCTDIGRCEATLCEKNYSLENGKCVSSTSNPDQTIECTSTDAPKCDDKGVYKCNSGHWELSHDLSSDVNNCGECGKLCSVEHSKSVECKFGSCVATTCEPEYMLVDGICKIDECTQGEIKCVNDENQIGKMYSCERNKFTETSTCKSNYSCKSDTSCGVCRNDTKQCSGANSQTCNQGEWSSSKCPVPTDGSAFCKGDGICDITCAEGYVKNGSKCIKPTSCEDADFVYYTSSGEEILAYCLRTQDDLMQLAEATFNGEKFPPENDTNAYVLANDITIDNAEWPGIGMSDSDKAFSGKFFGGGHKVKMTDIQTALFNKIDKGTVENLTYEITLFIVNEGPIGGLVNRAAEGVFNNISGNVTIEGSLGNAETYPRGAVGGLIGYDVNSTLNNININHLTFRVNAESAGGIIGMAVNSNVSDSNVDALEISKYSGSQTGGVGINHTGAVIGRGSGILTNVSATQCSINGTESVGGLIGNLVSNSNIQNCSSECEVNGESGSAGGIAGMSEHSEFIHTAFRGTINSSGTAGGFIGTSTMDAITSCVVDNVEFQSNNAKISGGFVGTSKKSTYNNCVSFADIDGADNLIGGGFIADSFSDDAKSDEINYCLSAGYVSGRNATGGFIGTTEKSDVMTAVNYSYSYTFVSNGEPKGGFAGNANHLYIHQGFWYNPMADYGAIGTGEQFNELQEITGTDLHGQMPEIENNGMMKDCTFKMTQAEGGKEDVTVTMPIPSETVDLLKSCN